MVMQEFGINRRRRLHMDDLHLGGLVQVMSFLESGLVLVWESIPLPVAISLPQ